MLYAFVLWLARIPRQGGVSEYIRLYSPLCLEDAITLAALLALADD